MIKKLILLIFSVFTLNATRHKKVALIERSHRSQTDAQILSKLTGFSNSMQRLGREVLIAYTCNNSERLRQTAHAISSFLTAHQEEFDPLIARLMASSNSHFFIHPIRQFNKKLRRNLAIFSSPEIQAMLARR